MSAATLSSPWGKPGSWALDAEGHEDELKQQQAQDDVVAAEFPSLSTAVKQPKKKKAQTVSLAEFSAYGADKSNFHDDIINLPTAPRQRSADELDRNSLGGGFKSYGLNNRNPNGDDSRWGGSNNNSRGFNRDSGRESMPSRADEVDDWSKTKKYTVGNSYSNSGFERRESGSLFESHSKADESDNWVASKPTETRRFEKRGSFDSLSKDKHVVNDVSAADSASWGRRKEEGDRTVMAAPARPKLVLQPRTLPVSDGNGTVSKPKGSSPFGEARPREEVLAEKGKDWKEIDEKLESLKVNNEKSERGDSGSYGWRSSGNRLGIERSWRKNDDSDSSSCPQSAENSENGHVSENGNATENGSTEEN
ncbi:hypothetical protein K2173_012693 [Erythroxylum novogranatense]|uniref:Eukaryotic translation initiation factor 4B3 n=1 Tax=Erythroxylum novogranatense TaxID=1862640 RepID=A0AAV8TJT1_9ROSI|nr:hypothetical protein K2173_012693 [Erythroxylum novogranatense]